jgi:hypothetical protein
MDSSPASAALSSAAVASSSSCNPTTTPSISLQNPPVEYKLQALLLQLGSLHRVLLVLLAHARGFRSGLCGAEKARGRALDACLCSVNGCQNPMGFVFLKCSSYEGSDTVHGWAGKGGGRCKGRRRIKCQTRRVVVSWHRGCIGTPA